MALTPRGEEIVAETTEYRALTDEEWWATVAPIFGLPPKQTAPSEATSPNSADTDEVSEDSDTLE